MAGIYFHIPFCHQACHYCDFHFTTVKGDEDRVVQAMLKELQARKGELENASVSSIYFGGGTPSLLPASMLFRLLNATRTSFQVTTDAEVTLEANPEDLTTEKLASWSDHGINRLSIGIQSFHDIDLRYMNRNHSGMEALEAVGRARKAGFELLTIDLIYGTPTMDDDAWASNLETMKLQGLDHFSDYALTVEPRTALHHLVGTRALAQPEEDQAARQFHQLMKWARQNDFEQYEISNFARNQKYSYHNTSYWRGTSYLGIGPSAHSFDGKNVRRWNVRNNHEYVRKVAEDLITYEQETLSLEERFDEYVMTSLRTHSGIDRSFIKNEFGSFFLDHLDAALKKIPIATWLEDHNGKVTLTDQGKLFADTIASRLFY
ncbi:MAG: radical SAM family heme chaperone HemW [Bacteroidota bacterium]